MIRKSLLWIRFILSWAIPRGSKFYYRQPHHLPKQLSSAEKRAFRTMSDAFYLNTSAEVLMLNPFYGHDGRNLEENFYRKAWKYRTARKLKTYCMERGPMPGTWIIDPTGFHAESHLFDTKNWDQPMSPETASKLQRCLGWLRESPISWETQGTLNNNELEPLQRLKARFSRINLVFMQMRKDSVVIMFPGFCGSQEGLLEQVLEQARALPEHLFLIKPHPLDPDWIEARDFPENVRLVSNVHYKDLIQLCDTITVMNSGLGCQAMAWSKPVIHLGRSYYRHEGLNSFAKNQDEFRELLLHPKYPDQEKMKRFFVYLLRVCSWENPDAEKPFLHIAWNKPEDISRQTVTFPY